MTQVSLSTSTTFNGDLNALVENQGTDVTFRIDLDEAAPAGGTRVYIDSDTVQIFNRLDLPAAVSNPRIENINLFSVSTNVDDSGLAFTIDPGATFATVTLTIFDNSEPDTFLPETFDGRVDAEFFVRTASEVSTEDAVAITGISDYTVDPNAASSVVIFVDDASQLPGETTNTPPVADNDSYSTDINTVLTVDAGEGVLDGDTDADGDSLTATIVDQPSNGSATLNSDGSFTYTPDNGFSGNDSFTYIANDGEDDSNPATVSITVNPLEKPTVGITLDKSDVVEGETITLTINVDGEIPTEGLRVFINDIANAQNDITRSLTEFDVANVELTGISGFPEPAQGDSGFFVTVTAPTATVTLPVLDDGFDEDEANEVFTFEVIDEEAYEVDANASSVTISIIDNEVSVNPRSSDFEDGTVQGWTVGQPGNHFAPPENIPSGGPDGAEDNYLRSQSQGGGGVGSRLVWFNQSADWRGNYIEDGATSIKASLINEGSEDVVIRVGFDGAGGRFVTTEGITLTPGSGWQEATFSIEPEDLTAVDGGSDVEATLSNVSQIRFLNNATPSYQGAAVPAQVGVDDITFMTEPPTNSVPVLSLTATPETLNEAEGTVITYNFSIDGEIPEGGLTFRSDDLFDAELNWRAFDFDNPSPDELSGLEIVDFERVVDERGNATFVVIWNMTQPEGFLKLGVLDDEVADAPSTFTVGLIAGEGYELNPDASDVTVEIIDGIASIGGPIISMAVSDTEVNEGDPFTVTFTAINPLPEGGQDIFVLSDVQNALGEFITVDENGNPLITTEGISNIEPTFRGFIATMVENTATISFDVFDDGPGEGPETFTYSLLDGETYDIDADSSTFAITVDDSDNPPTDDLPVLSLTATPETLNEAEGTVITYNFSIDGEIPEGGLTFRSDDLFDAELNWRAFDFDNPSPDELSGLEIVDFERVVDERGNATFVVIWNMTQPEGFLKLGVLDDDVADAPSSFTVGLVAGEGYELNPDASDVTVEIIDGVVNTGGPVISMAVSDTEVNEGDPFTVTFTAEGELPEGGQDIFVLSDVQNALGEFITVDENGNPLITTEGISNIEPTFRGFIATMVENTATISFDVFDDGPGEGPETFTYALQDGENYDIDADSSTFAITVDDGETPPEPTGGWSPGNSYDLVTPPPTYEGELSDGEQANADFVDKLEGEELLEDLQDGGYVIYFRHAQTERDYADQVTADVNDFSTQRVLSEFGIQQSLAIGEGFEISQIPYDEVITSQYGRAVKTAAIAFGEYQKDPALNFLPFEDYTEAQVEEMRANVTPLLTAVPDTGTNTIIVGHDDLFEAGTGIYPDPQGIAYLLKPDGNGDFELIANLLPEEWVELSEGVELPEVTTMPVEPSGGIGNGAGPISAENAASAEGWSPGNSFDLVTPPPTYEGELSDGEQANADFVDQLEGEELLEELQDGGYVIYFRHAQTEKDFADQVTADVNNFSTQRVLSEFGVKQSLAIGEGFELSEIPIGSVTTSDYGRAVETAAIAFGEYQKDSALNFLPFEDYTEAQVEEMRANVLPLLTAVPETGTNSIIVGHDDLFEAGTGIYPDPQGIAYVLDPDGNGGFEIVANLLPEEWVELSQDVVTTPQVSFSIEPDVVSEEGEPASFTGTFTVDGEIPTPEFDAEGNLVSGGLSILFDNTPNAIFAETEGNPIIDGFIFGDYFDPETNRLEFILLEGTSTFTLNILNDIIQEEDESFTFTVFNDDAGVLDSNYVVNPEASSDTVTLTDGITPATSPTVGISVSQTELTEGDELTVNFDVDGDIPAEGLQVIVESPTTGALGEFAIFDENGNFAISSEGITGDPEPYDGQGNSFLVTLTEPDASLTLNVFEDGPGEDTESLTFNLVDGEAYEVNADEKSVSLNISDIPEVSFSVNTTTLNEEEGTLFTFSFSVNGVIPEGGLEVALGGDVLPLIEQLDFSNFDFTNPDNVKGLEIGSFREDGSISLTLLETSGFVSVRVFDDIIPEQDASFDLTLLEGQGYSVNQEGSGATVTVIDGVPNLDTPKVALSVSDTNLTEGEEFTVNFSVDSDVSADKPLTVLVESTEVGALGEFNIFNEDNTPAFTTQGISGVPTVADDTGSSFFVTLTDTEASITLSVFNDGIGEGTETVNFALVDGESYGLDANNNQVSLTIEEGASVEVNEDGLVTAFAYDLSNFVPGETAQVSVSEEALELTDAAFDNLVGFYEVVDINGGIDTDGDGIADVTPEDGATAYAQAALAKAVDGLALRVGGDTSDNTTADEFDAVVEGGKFYAPFAIANAGELTVAEFLEINPNNDAATSVDDQVAYFAFGEANPDGANHLKSWGDGIFGFEDLPSNLAGVSDNDFNDAVFKFNFTA